MTSLPDDFRDKLMSTMDELKEYLVRDTAKLLTFETISGGKTQEEKDKFNQELNKCHDFLKTLAEEHGMVYREIDGIVSVIEQPSETGDKGLGIPLHVDVMPVSGDWKHPPFSGTVAEDIIWGRGAQDDKGPLMACLYGVFALKKLGARFIRPIHIVMGRGEEVGQWGDVQHFIEKEGAPAFSFTPDATFPIINGEKGIMNLRLDVEWDRPDAGGALRFKTLSGGTRANAVPDRAEIVFATDDPGIEETLKKQLEEFVAKNPGAKLEGPEKIEEGIKLSFLGESAHGSLPDHGHNAILDAVRFLSEHESASRECQAFCSFLYESCSKFFGDGFDIAVEHPFVGKTTVNLGVLTLDEKRGEATINVRPTLGLSCREGAERATSVVKAQSEKTGVRMYIRQTKQWGKEPLFVDPEENAFFISSLQEAYQAVTGREPNLESIGGTTFAKAYPNCVSFGPVLKEEEEELAHMTNEHVKVDHQLRNARIYAYAMALLTTDAVK